MSRVTTSNYGAEAATQFRWATTDNDLFDREFDLYNLSQAVELHDHSNGRGLEVARIAPGAISAAALGPLAVETANINNLAVTNAKLAAGAVTYDKITWPLIQPSNDMTGGFRMRDTSNTYAVGFYIAANGLAVFGSGTAPGTGILASMILGQAGQVSFGTLQGAGHVNVMQAANAAGNGIRMYHTNNVTYLDAYVSAGTYGVLGLSGNDCLFMSSGRVSLGVGSLSGLLTLTQPAASSGDGITWLFSTFSCRAWLDAGGNFVLGTPTTGLLFAQSLAILAPSADNTHALGNPSFRWLSLYVGTTGISNAGPLTSTTGTFSGALGSAAFSCTSLSVSSVVSHLPPVPTLTWTLGSATNRYLGAYIGVSIFDANGIFPFATLTGQIGNSSNIWSQITVNQGFQTGGGSWTAISDDKVKDAKAFRDYDQGLEQLLQLEPVYYKYSGSYGLPVSDQEYVGFRAQQLQKIVPAMVGSHKMRRTERSKEEEILTVNDSQLPYMLLNAIKELHARIAALENERRN